MMLGRRRKPREAFLLAVNPAGRATREIRLNRSRSSFGSDEANDLVMCDSTVSRHHALIRRHWGRWQVVDNRSSNGTYVGDRKAVTWTTLRDGEEVRFGGAHFVFRSGKAFSVRATTDFPMHKGGFKLRTVIVLIAIGLAGGFAATQYLLYRSYQSQVASSRSAEDSAAHGIHH